MLSRLALTPARFDVLFLLHRDMSRGDSKRQSAVRKALGVSRATICKMMQLLARLGFVERKRDGRQVDVWLTDLGRAILRHALKTLRLRQHGPLERVTHSIFVRKWWSEAERLIDLERVQLFFDRLRYVLSDRATLYYDWHPDD
jgi:DNA-binding MarR family transcriptional regulator